MSVSRAAERLGVTQYAISQPYYFFFALAPLNGGYVSRVCENVNPDIILLSTDRD